MGITFVERLLGRVADVDRRFEIRLADLQVNDLAALRLQRPGAGQDLERRLRSQPRISFEPVSEPILAFLRRLSARRSARKWPSAGLGELH